VIDENGADKRLNLNVGDPERIEQVIRACLSQNETPKVQGNGDLTIRCPFHSDSNPSCSVSPRKNGCFNCFGCGAKGSLSDLLMRLKQTSRAEVIQLMATVGGMNAAYREPDEKALATYNYRNEKAKLLKQTLRYADVDGKKIFRQRRPSKGGWIYNTRGLPPMLFGMELLEGSDVVCICEGEKDATTINSELLFSVNGYKVCGTTSGGAESWDAQLAKHFQGKKVIVMPDADAAGKKFGACIAQSLKSESIEYRIVRFEDVGKKDVTDFLADQDGQPHSPELATFENVVEGEPV
jgi:DNA primase